MRQGKVEKLARMANQIGDYHATLPPDQAVAGVALHIRKFWTPKMIDETLSALAQDEIKLNKTSAGGFAILRQEIEGAR